MPESISDKIAQMRRKIQGRMDALKDEIPWGSDSSDIQLRTRLYERSKKDLSLFDRVIRNLPKGFEFRSIGYVPDRGISDERDYFSSSMRRDFYKAVCDVPENRDRLMQMGLKKEHVTQLALTGKVPKWPNGRDIYDLSIEHIHDISLGGESIIDNLCLYPSYLNGLKSSFINAQIGIKGAYSMTDEVITFVPVDEDGAIPKVPLIPGGYRQPARGDEVRHRVNLFLGRRSVSAPALTHEAVPV